MSVHSGKREKPGFSTKERKEMQIITNETLIKNRARLGRIASFAGLAILVLGLVASLSPHELLTSPQWMLASFGCLFVGFLLSQVGIYNANRWLRSRVPIRCWTRS
jgi:Na+/pantothenate symporter